MALKKNNHGDHSVKHGEHNALSLAKRKQMLQTISQEFYAVDMFSAPSATPRFIIPLAGGNRCDRCLSPHRCVRCAIIVLAVVNS